MDRLYIPKPEDQLVITQDYCKKGQSGESGLSATLWAILEEKKGEQRPEVVARFSAPLAKQQQDLKPCDGEATAAAVAARCPIFRVPIQAATKRVISLLDNKPVYKVTKTAGERQIFYFEAH